MESDSRRSNEFWSDIFPETTDFSMQIPPSVQSIFAKGGLEKWVKAEIAGA